MNETQHKIYEPLFICNTSATHEHIYKNIWTGELHTVAWATELPPSYGLALVMLKQHNTDETMIFTQKSSPFELR